jgi:hypothetical protein
MLTLVRRRRAGCSAMDSSSGHRNSVLTWLLQLIRLDNHRRLPLYALRYLQRRRLIASATLLLVVLPCERSRAQLLLLRNTRTLL